MLLIWLAAWLAAMGNGSERSTLGSQQMEGIVAARNQRRNRKNIKTKLGNKIGTQKNLTATKYSTVKKRDREEGGREREETNFVAAHSG